MISEQGAILIATVYPIGLLVLLVEGVGALAAFASLFRGRFRLLSLPFILLMTSSVILSTAICIVSVSSGVTLDGEWAVFVGSSGILMGVFFCVAVGVLIGSGIPDLFGTKDK